MAAFIRACTHVCSLPDIWTILPVPLYGSICAHGVSAVVAKWEKVQEEGGGELTGA